MVSREVVEEQERYRLRRLSEMGRAEPTTLRRVGQRFGSLGRSRWLRWLVRDALLAVLIAGAVLGVELWQEGSRFEQAQRLENLRFVRTSVATGDPVRKQFHGMDLEGTNLSGLNLAGASMFEADLSGAVLVLSDLTLAGLSHTDLRRANFGSAILRGTVLRGADLQGAFLRGADLTAADLTGADLKHAVLDGVDFSDADLSDAVLDGAWWETESPPVWPEGFVPPENPGPPWVD